MPTAGLTLITVLFQNACSHLMCAEADICQFYSQKLWGDSNRIMLFLRNRKLFILRNTACIKVPPIAL